MPAAATQWPATEAALIASQEELARAAPPAWRPGPEPAAVGACFVCFPRGLGGRGDAGDPAWAAAAIARGRGLVGEAVITGAAGAPYVPGLLALREGPLLEAAVRRLPVAPDVVLVDATGRDHPRRAGLALHLGAVLDVPTIGVTSRPLLAVGKWPAGEERGARSPLRLADEEMGAWVRTRVGARPLAVHAAWRTDVATAVEVVLAAVSPARTPHPLRHARRLARVARAGETL